MASYHKKNNLKIKKLQLKYKQKRKNEKKSSNIRLMILEAFQILYVYFKLKTGKI
jgi:hypothetical protein